MAGSSAISKEIMSQITAAVQEAEYMAMGDMHEGLDVFYSVQPSVYRRTGQMASTPRTSGVTSSSHMAKFRAYLEKSGGYSTGKHPSMATVLVLANYGGVSGYRPTVGVKGFWEYSESLIEQSFYRAMASRFG